MGRVASLTAGLAVVAALAFFLLPTAPVNTRALVRVNGSTLSLPAGTKVADLGTLSSLVARPGSSLNLVGDVTAIGAGSLPVQRIGGQPLSSGQVLGDGSQVVVKHGEHQLEAIKRTTTAIPFDTTVKGSGGVVSVVQQGSAGEQEIYRGVSSGKQAAVLVATAPRERVLQKTKSPKPGQKLAALTFDDGPGTHTQEVLDALAREHVPATFFMLGSSAAGHKSLIAKMKAAGYEVENHTWSHVDLTKVSAAEFRSQVSRTAAVIGGGRFLRPPYGATNSTVKSLAASMGMRLAFWTVDTLDWQRQDVAAIMSHLKAQTRPGAIILMHDGGADRLQTVAAIPVVVDWLFEQGYSITTVDEIL